MGNRRGLAEGGEKTTETHLTDHIRSETFVQKTRYMAVAHTNFEACLVARYPPCESEHRECAEKSLPEAKTESRSRISEAEGGGKIRC